MSSYSSIKRQEIHKNRNKNFRLKKYFETQNLVAQNDELRAHLRNEKNLRFLINERSIKLSQEAEELPYNADISTAYYSSKSEPNLNSTLEVLYSEEGTT